MLFSLSSRKRFRRRCRRRLAELGWTIGKTQDLTVDIVGGLRGRPHVFVCRTADHPPVPTMIRDLQEMKLRYYDRRLVCLTEAPLTRNWMREAAERRVFMIAFDALARFAELPANEDEALAQHLAN